MFFLKLKIFPDFFQKTSNFADFSWSFNKFPDFPEVENLLLLVEIPRSKTKTRQGIIQKNLLDSGSPKKCDYQGIIQKKSVSSSRTLSLVIINKKKNLFPKIVLSYSISRKN